MNTENFFKITNGAVLDELFEKNIGKIIILMFYTKHNPECRSMESKFETLSLNNKFTIFCVIDVDKLTTDSVYTKNKSNMPRFDFYFNGNILYSTGTTDIKVLQAAVTQCQQHMMNQNNRNNNNPQNNITNQATIQQISNKILYEASMTDPNTYNYLMQNPEALQAMVMQKMSQIPSMQQPYINSTSQQPLIQPMQQPFAQPMQQPFTQPIQPIAQPIQPIQQLQQPLHPANLTKSPTIENPTSLIPSESAIALTVQQMQQMFQIFQMMQNMGVLKIDGPINISTSESHVTVDPPGTTVLPNGDKIVPMPNGLFGLIKKK